MKKLTPKKEKEIIRLFCDMCLSLDTADDIGRETYEFLCSLIADYDDVNEELKFSCGSDEDIDFDSFIDSVEESIRWNKYALGLLKDLKRKKLPLKQCIELYNGGGK
ncbi:hypothetical protein [Avibacterium avium]|uniref:hypothetical protein n=1 Tax=Avibacterium avium TaxID=751 RepID=UPI003BF88DCD